MDFLFRITLAIAQMMKLSLVALRMGIIFWLTNDNDNESVKDQDNQVSRPYSPLQPNVSIETSVSLTLSGPRVFLTMCSGGPEIHLCFLQNFADKTTDGKIRFSVSFLVSFKRFFHEEFFGRKECFIQPNFPRAFLRWKNARRASDVYVRRWPHRGVTLMTYIYVVGTERVKRVSMRYDTLCCGSRHWSILDRSTLDKTQNQIK